MKLFVMPRARDKEEMIEDGLCLEMCGTSERKFHVKFCIIISKLRDLKHFSPE